MNKIKGQSITMYQFMVTLTILLIVVFMTTRINAAEDLGQLNNARLHALEIAGVINMMEASPSGHFVIKKDLPEKCKTVEFGKGFVNLSTESASFVAGVIQVPDIEIVPKSIACKNKGSIEFTRELGVIEVR